MTGRSTKPSRALPPAVDATVQRVLDRAARRLLAETNGHAAVDKWEVIKK